MAVNDPYDWDDYRSDFVPSKAYEDQEAALLSILSALPIPKSVLEVGPGFGRVTKILTQLWPSSKGTRFFLADLSEAAIEQTSASLPEIDFAYEVLPSLGGLASKRPFPSRTFDLVVAIEVLLHIPPSQASQPDQPNRAGVQRAVNNLAASLRPPRPPKRAHGTTRAAVLAAIPAAGGTLITCDWTQALPPRANGEPTPVRNQNFRHDYPFLFTNAHPSLTVVAAVPTGLQTIFVVTRG